jgi:DNA replication protein DnaC
MEKRKDLSIQAVISTNESFYRALQSDVQELIVSEKEKIRRQRFIFPFVYPDFRDLIISFGSYCLCSRNQHRNFMIDKFNEPVIEQLFLYATNNPTFKGHLNRGIMLQGKYGCGKTILLKTYSLLHNHIVRKLSMNKPTLLFIKSVELQEQIRKQSVDMFVRRPLIIDEFGRESKMVQDYGNVIRPISELLSLRSDEGTITHGATNFNLSTLSSEEFYGGMIGDRLKEMFNFITLNGDSKRI